MVSLVRLMLFTTTVEILMVRTGSVQSCHQTPIFPYRGRARQTMLCCVCFYCEQFAALLVAPIRHCDMDAAAEFCHYLAACMCVLLVRVHHDVTVV